RIEELMEITHHSLIQYRLPTTGEIVPLLQIAPSKTDTERLLVVSPDLADVLSAIIVRVRDDTGTVPLVPAYDWHECIWRLPACHRTSPRSSQDTATSTSHSATRPSTPRRLSKPTWPSWPDAEACGPAKNIASPQTRNGKSSSGTSSAARSPQDSAAAPTPPHASTSTPACAARCTGQIQLNGNESWRSATTSPPGSPR